MHSANAFNLSRLRSRYFSRRPSSLAVALHARSYGLHVGLDIPSLWNIWMRSFKLYGKWLVQISITHKRAQYCSHASVGLAQARPKYLHVLIKNLPQASKHTPCVQCSLTSLGLAQAHPIKRERRNTWKHNSQASFILDNRQKRGEKNTCDCEYCLVDVRWCRRERSHCKITDITSQPRFIRNLLVQCS